MIRYKLKGNWIRATLTKFVNDDHSALFGTFKFKEYYSRDRVSKELDLIIHWSGTPEDRFNSKGLVAYFILLLESELEDQGKGWV